MSNWRKLLIEASKILSNDALVKDIPLFVDKTKPEDHKCSSCLFRIIRDGNKGSCTIMEGDISLKGGTCMFWSFGKEASTENDLREMRMSKKDAGYVEADFKIQCHTCKFYDKDWCKLWQGNVKDEQCCMAYDNDNLKWSK